MCIADVDSFIDNQSQHKYSSSNCTLKAGITQVSIYRRLGCPPPREHLDLVLYRRNVQTLPRYFFASLPRPSDNSVLISDSQIASLLAAGQCANSQFTYSSIDNRCYYASRTSATWVVARSACQHMGGQLAIIHDGNTNLAVDRECFDSYSIIALAS